MTESARGGDSARADSAQGGFAPLPRPVFAVLWVDTVLGNTGSFIRDVASASLVTDLSASPTAVALIRQPHQHGAPCHWR